MKCSRCGKRLLYGYYYGALVFGSECIKKIIKAKHGQAIKIKPAESTDHQRGLFDDPEPIHKP